jgi:hypothetical protein
MRFIFKPGLGIGMKNVVTFHDHLEYFSVIWYNLRHFGLVCGQLVYFFPVLVCLDQEKSVNPGTLDKRSEHLRRQKIIDF